MNSVPVDERFCVVTDVHGTVRWANDDAARLFNISRRGFVKRSLLLFFSHDRSTWAADLDRASRGFDVQRRVRIRPRDSGPITLNVEISRDEQWADPVLRWKFFTAPNTEGGP
jgi:hypothetical protein